MYRTQRSARLAFWTGEEGKENRRLAGWTAWGLRVGSPILASGSLSESAVAERQVPGYDDALGGENMRTQAALVSDFVLVTVGTLGLLANEFFFDWGRVAVLIFAACNLVGLFGLGWALLGRRSQ